MCENFIFMCKRSYLYSTSFPTISTDFMLTHKTILPMSSTSSSSSSSTSSPYVGIQIGLVALPAQIKYHGYPGADDSKSKTRSVEAYIFDEDTITALRNYEASAHADHPNLELNSIFTEQEEGKNVCIRMKFTKLEDRFSSTHPDVNCLEDLQYGDLFVSKCNVKKWQMGGSCGIVVYGNIIKCLGRTDSPVGAPFQSKLNWD